MTATTAVDSGTLCTAVTEGRWLEVGGGELPAHLLREVVLTTSPNAGAPTAVLVRDAVITGRLDLAFTEIEVIVRLHGCTFTEPPDLEGARLRTLDLSHSRLPGLSARLARVQGDLRLADTRVHGSVVLENAEVTGSLQLSGALLEYPQGRAFSGGGLVVGGGITGRRGLRVVGEMRAIGAQVSGGVLLEGAQLVNPGRAALCLDELRTNRISLSGGFRADGEVTLRNAVISGAVDLQDAVLLGAERSLRARGLQAGELLLRVTAPRMVDLARARIGALREDPRPQYLPPVLRLDGLEYQHLIPLLPEPTFTLRQRLEWLDREDGVYRPQPYEQYAAYLRQIGHDGEARRVLLAKERRRRTRLRPPARAVGLLMDAMVGYGYRSWLAGLWLVVLVAMGTVTFTADHMRRIETDRTPSYSALIYSIDLVVPLESFGERSAFEPRDDTRRWVAHTLTGAGWLLATALVAGVSRSLGRD